jgi:acetyltransferase-like isoleucine patch superfamily enzyme
MDVIEIRVPKETVSDEFVVIAAWLADDGEAVDAGDLVVAVETSKAVIEIEAPAAGRLRRGLAEGQRVAVGAVIALLSDDPDVTWASWEESRLGAGEATLATAGDGPRFSRRAARLAAEHGIVPAAFAGVGLVTEAQVRTHLEVRATGGKRSVLQEILAGIDLRGVTFPEEADDSDRGRMDPAFLERMRADLAAFAAQPSDAKVAQYRAAGAEIGAGAALGPGAWIDAPQVIMGPEASIGAQGQIRCREKFALGELGVFGPRLELGARQAIFGPGLYAGRDIRIGGGGHRDPWAVIVVGPTGYLGDELFLNVGRPIVAGREVFVTMRSILVTHNIGHSPLAGFENRFAPIVMEDRAQVGMQCTVYAGVRVGRASIVGSNSYVVTSVPAGKLALGVPAKVARDAAQPLDAAARRALGERLVADFHRLLAARGHQPGALAPVGFEMRHDGHSLRLRLVDRWRDQAPPAADGEVILALDGCDATPRGDGCLFDLELLRVHGTAAGAWPETVREYLRKRGMRFEPGPWRYRSGLI